MKWGGGDKRSINKFGSATSLIGPQNLSKII